MEAKGRNLRIQPVYPMLLRGGEINERGLQYDQAGLDFQNPSYHALTDLRHECDVQSVNGIRGSMIVRIAVE